MNLMAMGIEVLGAMRQSLVNLLVNAATRYEEICWEVGKMSARWKNQANAIYLTCNTSGVNSWYSLV